MIAVSDFSGFASSIWALARAAAMAPMVGLERCISHLLIEELKAHRTGLRTLGPQPASARLLGVLRHHLLQLGLGLFVREKGRPGPAKGDCELGPAVGPTHVDDAHRRQPRPRRLSPLMTQRQNFFSAVRSRCWYSGSACKVSSTHLLPPVITDKTADRALATHMLCCSWAMCLSAAASSENAHGSMNLASNTAPPGSIRPTRVAAIHLTTGCWICR